MRLLAALVLLGSLSVSLPALGQESPYTDLQSRGIKALSEDRIEGFLEGKGLGFALAAELNGYPGPLHVLQLAEKLELSQQQHARVTAIFDAMHSSAAALGEQIVSAEGALEAAFSGSTITKDSLHKMVVEIGHLTGQLRAVHLAAHIETKALLSEKQVHLYTMGRGYQGSERGGMGHGSHADHANHMGGQ